MSGKVLRRAGFLSPEITGEATYTLHCLTPGETLVRTVRADQMLRDAGYRAETLPPVYTAPRELPHEERTEITESALLSVVAEIHNAESPRQVAHALEDLTLPGTGVLGRVAEAVETAADWVYEARSLLPEGQALAERLAEASREVARIDADLLDVGSQLASVDFRPGPVQIRPGPVTYLGRVGGPPDREAAGASLTPRDRALQAAARAATAMSDLRAELAAIDDPKDTADVIEAVLGGGSAVHHAGLALMASGRRAAELGLVDDHSIEAAGLRLFETASCARLGTNALHQAAADQGPQPRSQAALAHSPTYAVQQPPTAAESGRAPATAAGSPAPRIR